MSTLVLTREPEQVAIAAGPEVEIQRGGPEIIAPLAGEWRELGASLPNELLFSRPEWVEHYVRSSVPAGKFLLVTVRSGGKLVGVLPLIEESIRLTRLPANRLRGASDYDAWPQDLVAIAGPQRQETIEAIWAALKKLPDWHVLEFPTVPEGGVAEELLRVAKRDGYGTDQDAYMQSLYMRLPAEAPQDVISLARSASLRRNLRRSLRKLESEGKLTRRHLAHADRTVLDKLYELEKSGWKGENGSAVGCNPAMQKFYDEIAETAARHGYLSLHVLEFNGKVIAVSFALEYRGTYHGLKLGIDESLAAHSPGQLLICSMLEEIVQREVKEYQFMGMWAQWKAQWAEHVRPHSMLYIYRNSLYGRGLHLAATKAAPAVRRLLRRGPTGEGANPRRASKANEAEEAGSAKKTEEHEESYRALTFPELSPGMLLPRLKNGKLPFPFQNPATEYFYFARTAIYALAEAWGLRDQEVLFPAYCCGIEVTALEAAGARVKFYPVDRNLKVDPAEVIRRIGRETRAVYLIHYFGFPGPVEELAAACRERGVGLIEDCALALFSRSVDKPLGSFGDAAVFSIHKSLPVPAGGALLMRTGDRARLPQRTAPPLRSTASLVVGVLQQTFETRGLGWVKALIKGIVRLGKPATRLSKEETIPVFTNNFDASLVRLKMSRLSHWIVAAQKQERVVEGRRRSFERLQARLKEVAEPIFPELAEGTCPLMYPVRCRDSRAASEALRARGVEAWAFWDLPTPGLPAGASPEVEELRKTIVAVPCHQDLSAETLDFIAAKVREVLELQRQ